VGAAILCWHALAYLREGGGRLCGVLGGEDLARLLPSARMEAIRRDMVAWDLHLVESARDATPA
jgi:saccharopine dehydrogenase (NAD+, L-lysine-forming)